MNDFKNCFVTFLYYAILLALPCAVFVVSLVFFLPEFISGRFDVVPMVLTAVSCLFFSKPFFNFMSVWFCYLCVKFFPHIFNVDNVRFLMFEGSCGCGKTFTSLYFACIKCQIEWRKLYTYYLTYQPNALLYYKDYCFMTENERADSAWLKFKAVKDSIDFYLNNGYIYCCYANFKFKFQDKEPIPFDINYLLDKKRFAEYNITLIDESAEMLPNTMRTAKKFKDGEINVNKINTNFSMSRQNAECNFCFTEQRSEEMFLGARTLLNVSYLLTAQTWVLKPMLLIWYRDKIIDKLMKKGFNDSRKISARLIWLNKTINKIGFRKIDYIKNTSIKGRVDIEKSRSYVLPCNVPYTYDDRQKRNEYEAKDLSLWDSLAMSENNSTFDSNQE